MLANAPAFARQPAILALPRRNPHYYSADDGQIIGGTVQGRRWLLDGTSISTAVTIFPSGLSGTLVLEVTATGTGGPTVATSNPVKIGSATPNPNFKGVIDTIFAQVVTDDLFGAQVVTD